MRVASPPARKPQRQAPKIAGDRCGPRAVVQQPRRLAAGEETPTGRSRAAAQPGRDPGRRTRNQRERPAQRSFQADESCVDGFGVHRDIARRRIACIALGSDLQHARSSGLRSISNSAIASSG